MLTREDYLARKRETARRRRATMGAQQRSVVRQQNADYQRTRYATDPVYREQVKDIKRKQHRRQRIRQALYAAIAAFDTPAFDAAMERVLMLAAQDSGGEPTS